MSFGSNGMDWVCPLRKIQLQDFLYQKCPERPSCRFSHSFSCQNQNSKNALNMSFGSNGTDWVRPLRKIQQQIFSYQKCPERPSWSLFTQFFLPQLKLQKRAKHEFWVKRDGLGVSVVKKSTTSFLYQKYPERPWSH